MNGENVLAGEVAHLASVLSAPQPFACVTFLYSESQTIDAAGYKKSLAVLW